jgi:DNA-binding LacI/PurR family transcriptional regulator
MEKRNSRLTIDDIAKMAGVSKTTVSRVINQKPDVHPNTRKRINDLIEEVNFHPNLFATGKTSHKINHIGLIVPYTTSSILSNQFYVGVLQGILDEVERRDHYLLFCYVHQTNYREIYEQKRVEGFILLSPAALHHSIILELEDANIPFISTAKVMDEPEIPYVDIDNVKGAELAVDHLLELGHRKIAFAGKPILSSNHDRLFGYRQTLQNNNVPINEAYVQAVDVSSIETGYNMMLKLLALEDPPTAVFSSCDVMAFGAMKAINEKGLKVPDDISIVGFDDIPLSRNMTPSLTTVRQPAIEKGAIAAGKLIDFLVNGKSLDTEILDVELVVRDSTGPVRK